MTAAGIDVDKHEALRLVGQFKTFIGLCSCGTPEEFLRQVQAGLEAHAAAGELRPEGESAGRGGWSPRSNPAHMMVMYLLDCWELTEHGTRIAGAWLTRAGIRLRDAMRQVDLRDGSSDIDALYERGWWWEQEHQLHPRGRDGSGIVSMGDWEDHDDG